MLVKPGILESPPDKPLKMNMYRKKKVVYNNELELCNITCWLLWSKAGKCQKAVINSSYNTGEGLKIDHRFWGLLLMKLQSQLVMSDATCSMYIVEYKQIAFAL